MKVHQKENNEAYTKILEFVHNWKSSFKKPPVLDFTIGLTFFGSLTVNGVVLCPAKDINIEHSYFDAEELVLSTFSDVSYTIQIFWPKVGPARIASITKSERLYISR